MDIDVPIDLFYSPTLTIYIYDNVLGLFEERLIGCANIPLYASCQELLESKL
jgi:hypothetical protein